MCEDIVLDRVLRNAAMEGVVRVVAHAVENNSSVSWMPVEERLGLQQNNPMVPLASVAGLLAFVFMLKKLVGNGKGSRLRLPPGPAGRPVIGHLHLLGKSPHISMMEMSKTYGEIMSLRLGVHETVVISSPALAKEILMTQDHLFASRPRAIPAQLLFDKNVDMGFSPLGDHWRHMRKICTVELFNPKRIQQFQGARRELMLRTVERILEDGRDGNLQEIDLKIQELTFNNITEVLFRKKYLCQKGMNSEIDEDARELHDLILETGKNGFFVVWEYIPCLRFLDAGGVVKQLRKFAAVSEKFLQRVVQDHRHAKHDDHLSKETPDFVDVLLQLQEDKEWKGNLPDTHIKGLLLDLLHGAIDTTSMTVVWALSEIMRHPEVGDRIRSEMNAVVGEERLLEESDIPKLKYLKAVVKEVLRLHPSLPLLIPHFSTGATKVAGYDISANTRVYVNVYAIGRDPEVWENPLRFRPERFLESSVDLKGHNYELLPFGAGRRICPAQNLGLLMAELILAQLLHTIDFSLPPGMNPADLNMEEGGGAVPPRVHPIELLAKPRLPRSVYSEASIDF